jgi:cellulose synthase A
VEGDEDEEGIDDIDDEKQKQEQLQGGAMQSSHITEAMLHGKMSYGRGPEDGDGNNTPMIPPIITGSRSVPVHSVLSPPCPFFRCCSVFFNNCYSEF